MKKRDDKHGMTGFQYVRFVKMCENHYLYDGRHVVCDNPYFIQLIWFYLDGLRLIDVDFKYYAIYEYKDIRFFRKNKEIK